MPSGTNVALTNHMKDAFGNEVKLGGYLITSHNDGVVIGKVVGNPTDEYVALFYVMPPLEKDDTLIVSREDVGKSLYVRRGLARCHVSNFTLEHKQV